VVDFSNRIYPSDSEVFQKTIYSKCNLKGEFKMIILGANGGFEAPRPPAKY